MRPPGGKPPWWAQFLQPHITDAEALSELLNRSTSAVLLLTAADRRFAFTFGYGRHLLEPDSYEQDFGLKVVLNTVEPDELRSVDTRTFEDITAHTRRDLSRGSPFGAFGFDVTRDLVRAVTGPPRDPTLGRRATGSDALALMTRADFNELPDLCEQLLTAYGADDYKERFAWIDYLRQVRDVELVTSLNDDLLSALRTGALTDIHLAPPQPVDWSRVDGFTFSTRRNAGDLDSDPRITSYLESVGETESLNLDQLKRDRVLAIGAEADEVIDDWPVYRCVVYESRREGVLYALSAGQWYSVSGSFAEEVERFARQLPLLDVDLPIATARVSEADYNAAAAEALGALCMDRQLVQTPTGDRIEVCDVLALDGKLIHVKKRGSSSTLSHLFAQGLVSAELLAREPTFRDQARTSIEALDPRFVAAIRDERPDRESSEVSYVVITRSQRDTPLTLPFFSLVHLRAAAQRLQDIGYKVSIQKVEEQEAPMGAD